MHDVIIFFKKRNEVRVTKIIQDIKKTLSSRRLLWSNHHIASVLLIYNKEKNARVDERDYKCRVFETTSLYGGGGWLRLSSPPLISRGLEALFPGGAVGFGNGPSAGGAAVLSGMFTTSAPCTLNGPPLFQ